MRELRQDFRRLRDNWGFIYVCFCEFFVPYGDDIDFITRAGVSQAGVSYEAMNAVICITQDF